MSTVLRQLAQEGSAEFVGYQNSILMQLLSGKGGVVRSTGLCAAACNCEAGIP
jgi:hypothetical protein